MTEPSTTAQQQLFPPPPAYYSLYGSSADGSAERPAPPPPPPPVEGEYLMFGEMHTAAVGFPPLQVPELYKAPNDGQIDFRTELQALHKELLACIGDLFSALELHPSTYARAVESTGTVLRNMQHLTRLLRPIQARLTLIRTLQEEVRMRNESASALDELAKSHGLDNHLHRLQQKLVEIVDEQGKILGNMDVDTGSSQR